MAIKIGNAPCSWGVEFADDDRNPAWETVLKECTEAGYYGIELGPVGYMPEDPELLKEKFIQHQLTMIGGVIFRPFHDPGKWDYVLDGARRTCKAVQSHQAKQLVIIDSIAPDRAKTAGRPHAAAQFDNDEWKAYVNRIATVAKIAQEDYGLTASIHPHAGGYTDFLDEVERLLHEIDESLLKICLDTGHCLYAGFDPIIFLNKYITRVNYVHLKDIDLQVKQHVIANKLGFYDACAQGVFCNLGQGAVNFLEVKHLLEQAGYDGWCTVEQDCDPKGNTTPKADAQRNREYLSSIGL